MIKIPYTDYMFTYGTIAHGALALTYLLFNTLSKYKTINYCNIVSLFYLIGHIFIFNAMLLRIDSKYIGSKTVSISGIIGHSFLTMFAIFFYIYTKNINNFTVIWNKAIYNYKNIAFIIGQLGMISIYIYEYIYKDIEKPTHVNYIYLSTFSILTIYYLYTSINKFNSGNIFIICSMILVGILYLIFLINQLYIMNKL